MTTQQFANPMGTDGFECVEFCSLQPEQLARDFANLGFTPIAQHRHQNIVLYRQGQINFLLNKENNSHAHHFARAHGAAACAMGFRVKNAEHAFDLAVKQGAEPGKGTFNVPTIMGVGGSLIYFVDHYRNLSFYNDDFVFFNAADNLLGSGLTCIDHLTHNVRRGEMNRWAEFYERLFNFREIRYFDIRGQATGLISRAMTSPCGKIRIPINESLDEQSQIEEFIRDFKGEGIQHIALGTDDIHHSVEQLRAQTIHFLDIPDTYYEAVERRVPWHQEDLPRLKQNQILIDGTITPEGGLLLQLFTENMLGPVFFEVIQRKGNDGFGEGNFQALFEAIECDQIRRGVVQGKGKTV